MCHGFFRIHISRGAIFLLLLVLILIATVGCNPQQIGEINSAVQAASTMAAGTLTAQAASTAAGGGQAATQAPGGAQSGGQPTTQRHYGVQTKTSGCVSKNYLPDPDCTPGAIISTVTLAQLCQPGYATSVRNVPDSEKNQVYAEYGIATHTAGEYEVDHLISLELGGSNDIANLWPQPAEPKPGFHEKDKVENYTHDQVCSHAWTLQEAQDRIASNWFDIYNQMPK